MELTSLTVTQMKSGLKEKKFSSLELTQSHLDKIKSTLRLNTFLYINESEALQSAKRSDDKLSSNAEIGSLEGIPVALKDIIHLEGTKTTCGSKILENFVAPYDATVTTKLKDSGAVIIGKTNMDEFAMGSSNETSFFGPVKNPIDESRVPGGSSGGSSAAVLAGQVPLSLGTDTGGSIRQPASLCGIAGIKPTYGRVSRYGVIAYASSLDQVGPFARTVEDCALITEVISGYCSNDSTSVDMQVPSFVNSVQRGVKGLRVGLPKEYFIDGIEPDVQKSIEASIKVLEKEGAKIVDISLPHTQMALSVYYIIAPAEASSNLARYDGIRYGYRAENTENLLDLYCKTRAEGFGREVKRRIMIGSYVLSAGYYDAYYKKAQQVRALITKDFSDAFKDKCDVIASPASPTTAFKIGEKTSDPLAMYLSDVFTIPVNLAGLPGLSVPCGYDTKGLPIGLQIIGRPFDEESIFATAGAYERCTDWNKSVPCMVKKD